jgi:hypothetical protein
MRSLLQSIINALLSADADVVVGATGPHRAVRRSATATGTATWTPRSEPLTSRSQSSGRAPTSRSGCWSAANAPSPR